VHTDEVFFRDTAHGFLAWCIASLVVAAFLASAVSGIVSGGASIASSTGAALGAGGGAVVAKAAEGTDTDYWADTILRSANAPNDGTTAPAATSNDRDTRAEVGRILATSLSSGTLAPADKQYLAQLAARRAGVDQAEGERRVDAAFNSAKESIETAKTKAKQAADEARKAIAGLSFWMFLSLLCGAFAASFAATIGGRHRERFVYVTRRV